MFSLYECIIEKNRHKKDLKSSFISGGLTTTTISITTGLSYRGLLLAGLSGGTLGVVMEKLFDSIH